MTRKRRERNGDETPAQEPVTVVAGANLADTCYELRLYTTGVTPLSARAISNIRRLCDTHLSGRYALEIVDIIQQPEMLKQDQVLAAPTLIKRYPLPARRFIGDMSRTETLLRGLDLSPDTKPHE